MLAPCFGALKWDTQRVELSVKPGEKEAIGVFRFANTSATPVEITSVQPSCGCTTTELAKKTYAPGETGEIKAVLHIGDQTGPQEKTIQVFLADNPNLSTTLTLRVNIPELLNAPSRMLLWRTAEILTEKSVIMTNSYAQKITAVEQGDIAAGLITARIETLEAGSKYKLGLLPASIAKPMNLAVPFVIKFADNTVQRFVVYAVVK